jgi:ribulose 1,5-bisphosphate synthetase/thiazole synthase
MKHNVREDFAERVRINQHKLSSKLSTRFDYIVCGAGTSGSVVAARLATDLKTQVLLLNRRYPRLSNFLEAVSSSSRLRRASINPTT